jgi:hypothetical protein
VALAIAQITSPSTRSPMSRLPRKTSRKSTRAPFSGTVDAFRKAPPALTFEHTARCSSPSMSKRNRIVFERRENLRLSL